MKKIYYIIPFIIIFIFLFFKGPLSNFNPYCLNKWSDVLSQMEANSDCKTDKDCTALSCGCFGPKSMEIFNKFNFYCNMPANMCLYPTCICMNSKCAEDYPSNYVVDGVRTICKEDSECYTINSVRMENSKCYKECYGSGCENVSLYCPISSPIRDRDYVERCYGNEIKLCKRAKIINCVINIVGTGHCVPRE